MRPIAMLVLTGGASFVAAAIFAGTLSAHRAAECADLRAQVKALQDRIGNAATTPTPLPDSRPLAWRDLQAHRYWALEYTRWLSRCISSPPIRWGSVPNLEMGYHRVDSEVKAGRLKAGDIDNPDPFPRP
jgi:hypothetical protein